MLTGNSREIGFDDLALVIAIFMIFNWEWNYVLCELNAFPLVMMLGADHAGVTEASSAQASDSISMLRRTFIPHPLSESGIGNVFKADEPGLEITVIALPALVALASDRFALPYWWTLHSLGSVELGALCVSISIINLVPKMFKLPLLNVTTSFVAEGDSIDKDLPRKLSHMSRKGCFHREL